MVTTGDLPVDNVRTTLQSGHVSEAAAPVSTAWFGVVVPKRNAKRAVTRTLLKRQMRNAALRLAEAPVPADGGVCVVAAGPEGGAPVALRAGLWVVRLRAPFDRARYPSAASDALRFAARAELDAVMQRAARKSLSLAVNAGTGATR